MKTTQRHFQQFKASFLYWQKELSCLDYKATFEHVHLHEKFALISINHEGRSCCVSMCTDLGNAASPSDQLDPELHGKHEAIHLLLSRLASLAHSRFCMIRELEDAEEGIVRVLEKLL